MEARKLLYTVMVVAPAIALAGIGVHSRTYVDPYRWPSTGADQHRVNAYIDVVAETCRYISHHPAWLDTVDRPELLRLAGRWVDETKAGKLQPLVPVAYDDVLLGGIKGQIMNSMVVLNRSLVRDADRMVRVGRYKEAANEVLLAIRMANSVKYSSFITVYRCSMLQGAAVNRLNSIYEKLPQAERLAIKEELLALDKGVAPLNEIANHAKQLYLQALRAHEVAEIAVEQARRVIPSKSFFEQPALAKEKHPESKDVVYRTLRLPDLNTDASLCMEAENYLRLNIQRVLSLK